MEELNLQDFIPPASDKLPQFLKPEPKKRTKLKKTVLLQVPKGDRFKNSRSLIKRNEKCPCGSGKKFKHCHLNLKPQTENGEKEKG
jgi:uncharacterized protein YecA (UPF0149 family)